MPLNPAEPGALQIVGGGRMGQAFAERLTATGRYRPDELAVVETSAERRVELARLLPAVRLEAGPLSGVPAVLAVKPVDAESACRALAAGRPGPARVVSIVAGVTTRELSTWLGDRVAVLRAMPNVAALVGASATALAAGPGAGDAERAWAVSLLGAVGRVWEVPERLLDAVTGLSGSGPAFLCLALEALEEGGVAVGLGRQLARELVTQTVVGLAELLSAGRQAAEVREAVTSPGGTTAAGIGALEDRAARGAFLGAVVAATSRSNALGHHGPTRDD